MAAGAEQSGAPTGEPPASEVVNARLLRLIRELQQPPAARRESAGSRYVVEPSAPELAADVEPEADDWLDRLRHQAEPEAVAEASPEPRARLREAAGRAVEFGREHLAAVVVVLLVGVAWSAYSLLQARSSPVAAAAPVIQSSAPASPQTAPSAPAQLVVHVIGAVRKPGVVKLPEGSRVSDAIAAAGGLGDAAAPGELNLALVLDDGVQLKIGTRTHPGGWIRQTAAEGASAPKGGTASGASAKVALNSATLEQLDSLPGIGPVTAQKILDWRSQHGRFTAVSELQEVDGIGPKTYANLEKLVRL